MIKNTARSLLDLNVTGFVPFSAIVLVPTTNAPTTCLTTPTLHLQGLLISFLFAKKPKIINFGTFLKKVDFYRDILTRKEKIPTVAKMHNFPAC